MVMLDLEGTI